MSGYIDLHCHCVPGVDDGARHLTESIEILRALRAIGFSSVVTTPHIRPGMFDNSPDSLQTAFEHLTASITHEPDLPQLRLSSEHFFDDVVFQNLMHQHGLPYPGGHSILLEFYTSDFPHTIDQRLADLRRQGYLPVIAHPERYEPLWKEPQILERLLDLGCAALLDAGALTGRYGRRPQRAARDFLEQGLYRAACSDAHRVSDVQATQKSIAWLKKEYGDEEVTELFCTGPLAILEGRHSN